MAGPPFKAIQVQERGWVPDLVLTYWDVAAEENEEEGEEMDPDVHIKIQVPLAVAPDIQGRWAIEGLP